MTGWPQDKHVATSWSISYASNKRVGTCYIYEHELDERQGEKGFRWRPSYLQHRQALASHRENGS